MSKYLKIFELGLPLGIKNFQILLIFVLISVQCFSSKNRTMSLRPTRDKFFITYAIQATFDTLNPFSNLYRTIHVICQTYDFIQIYK